MRIRHVSIALLAMASPAMAEWRPATPEIAAAAREPRIAAALAATARMDAALIADDQATFQSMLAPELAVNNPQNGVSVRGATGRRGAAGAIRYARYVRTIEYVGRRGDLVVLMGDEEVAPRGADARPQRRRFTDVWREEDGRWLLTVRQATVVVADSTAAERR